MMATPAALFRLLGDDARLRILRLLDAERLNVTELTSILGIAQSGVSRHLGLLKDARLVDERREAGFTFFQLSPALKSGENGFGPVWPLLHAQFTAVAETPEGRADTARLEEVRRVRQENFDEHGAADERRQIVPGRSWAAWARALGHLLPDLEIADLGCGEGYLTIEASRFAKRVIGVDKSEAALKRARELAGRLARRSGDDGARRARHVEWKRGEIEKLPLEDASVDVALLSQALHHAEHPQVALAEAVRIIRPGGRVLILELRRHQETWVRERLGDKWLGFEDDELRALMEDAGLSEVKITVGARRARDPFTVLIASGAKKAVAATSKKDRRNAR
jgi:ubiquinone/menaquinone biosynthesis C-methylase UbiE